MEKAEDRLLLVIPLSLALIFVLLYIAFHSFLDAIVILSNVFDLAIGGIWAFYLTGTQLQHLGRGRLRVAVRRGHHGRAADDLLLQRPARPGPAVARSDRARCRQARTAGDDHGVDRHPRAAAGRTGPAARLDASNHLTGSSRSARRRSNRWPSSSSAA